MQPIEVFYVSHEELPQFEEVCDEPGWYWWACHPGCLPDGEANGPYLTRQQAEEAARER